MFVRVVVAVVRFPPPRGVNELEGLTDVVAAYDDEPILGDVTAGFEGYNVFIKCSVCCSELV
jgi:hypothetical protein